MLGIRLSIKLPLMVILGVLLMAGAVSVMTIFAGRNILHSVVQETNVRNVQTYARAIDFYLDNARSLLEVTADLPEMRDMALGQFIYPPDDLQGSADVAQCKTGELILEHSNVFEYIMLLRTDGSVHHVGPHDLWPGMSRHDLAFSTWYREVIARSGTVVSNLHISPITQRPTVIIATPVNDSEGRLIGIWAGGLKLDQLSKIGRTGLEKGTPEYDGYITDGRGLVIAHQTKPKYVREQTDFSSVPPVRAALSGQPGASQYINPTEGEEKLGAYLPLDVSPSAELPEDHANGPVWAVVYEVPAEVAFASIGRLTLIVLLIAVVVAFLMILVSFKVVRQITGPLQRLAAGTESIGAGDFNRRIDIRTGDEIEVLANEFNQMAAALAEKDAELRTYAEELEGKVEERTKALKQQAEELARSNEELEKFAYVSSHDLQEPLRMVSSYVQLLARRYQGKLDSDADEFISYAIDGATRMKNLINDLLAYSRVGTRGNPFQATNLESVYDQALFYLQISVEESGAVITCDKLPSVMADPVQMVQVFQNLISNAVKFRGPNPLLVHVSAEEKETEWVFSVRDNGIGILEEYSQRIFEIFQRLHGRTDYPGTGIGLAICKKIVERHGGRIWVESEPGEGSSFCFTLPVTDTEKQ